MRRHSASSKPLGGGRGGEILNSAQPPRGIASPEIGVECQVRGRGFDLVLEPRPVENQRSARRQDLRRAFDQPERCGPRADVRHVDVEHGIGPVDRPVGRAGVDDDRLADVRRDRSLPPGRDRRQGVGMRVARLPVEVRESARRTRLHARRSRSRPPGPSRSPAASPPGPRRSARDCAAPPERSAAHPALVGPS